MCMRYAVGVILLSLIVRGLPLTGHDGLNSLETKLNESTSTTPGAVMWTTTISGPTETTSDGRRNINSEFITSTPEGQELATSTTKIPELATFTTKVPELANFTTKAPEMATTTTKDPNTSLANSTGDSASNDNAGDNGSTQEALDNTWNGNTGDFLDSGFAMKIDNNQTNAFNGLWHYDVQINRTPWFVYRMMTMLENLKRRWRHWQLEARRYNPF